MLGFFRKYQKFFFIVVTVFVVISFSFFGTFSTAIGGDRGEPDRTVGRAVDGTAISERELDTLVRLLSSSLDERAGAPNLLNDGVVQKEFLATGMGSLLAEHYFDALQEAFAVRLRKAQQYRPYVHPQAPFISAERVWQQYFPGMSQDLDALRALPGAPSRETFALLARLYLAQQQLPPDTLRQLLLYQQHHFQNLPPDPYLQQRDLSLFGFHTLDDWFGVEYLQTVCRFILNAAAEAKSRGYHVSREEARAALLRNVHMALSHYGQEEQSAGNLYQRQLQLLQIDEASSVKAWQSVMLFRRLFHDVGSAAVVDPLAYEYFNEYAKESVAVELYELPREFRFKSALEALSFETYLEAVVSHRLGEEVPRNLEELLDPESVAKRTPELVERSFELEVKEVKREQVAAQISLKESWDWELADENRAPLERAFGDLFSPLPEDEAERCALLDQLSPEERLRVDQFARQQILLSRPEQIEHAFMAIEPRRMAIAISAQGGTLPLEGINDVRAFERLLLSAAAADDSERGAAERALARYTEGGEWIYEIKVLSASPDRQLISFGQAQAKGALLPLVEARLKEAYPKVRRRDPALFQREEGGWKEWHEVKEEIARLAFPRRAEALLKRFVEQAREQLVESGEDTLEEGVKMQWNLVKSEKRINRASHDPLFSEGLLCLGEGEWSPVLEREGEGPCFVRVLEKVPASTQEEPLEGQAILSTGARRYLTTQLLARMDRYGV